MMVGWIAFLFGLSCFLVALFSLYSFSPIGEEGEKKSRSIQENSEVRTGEFWDSGKGVRL